MIAFGWNTQERRWAARALAPGSPAALDACARLLPLRGDRAALLAAPGVTVNGLPAGPLRMLSNGDEIGAPAGTFCFSTGTLPETHPYTAGETESCCPRCHDPLPGGEPVINCPNCQAPYHERCFSYAMQCPACGQATEVWVPDPLE